MVTFPSLATTTCLDMMIGAGNQNEKIVKIFTTIMIGIVLIIKNSYLF